MQEAVGELCPRDRCCLPADDSSFGKMLSRALLLRHAHRDALPDYSDWEGRQGAWEEGDRIGLLLDLDAGSLAVYMYVQERRAAGRDAGVGADGSGGLPLGRVAVQHGFLGAHRRAAGGGEGGGPGEPAARTARCPVGGTVDSRQVIPLKVNVLSNDIV
jgi:hypothetical protein